MKMPTPNERRDSAPPWDRFAPLSSPGFLIGLFVLLLNDHALKQAFPGVLTGKLSDFAGLFVFPLFLAVLLPRYSSPLYLGVAAFFVFWKSPASTTAIAFWNDVTPVPVDRVVDFTDLYALSVLPISYYYLSRLRRSSDRPANALRRVGNLALVMISIFAFTATSNIYRKQVTYDPKPRNAYHFTTTKDDVIKTINSLKLTCDPEPLQVTTDESQQFDFRLPSKNFSCDVPLTVTIVLQTESTGATVHLREISYTAPKKLGGKKQLRETFEDNFVRPLRTTVPTKSSETSMMLKSGEVLETRDLDRTRRAMI